MEGFMDDKLKHQLLIVYMQEKSLEIKQLSLRNSGLSLLNRFFDDIDRHQLESFLPNHLLAHLDKLETVKEGHHLDLWIYDLAFRIRLFLLDPINNQIKPDFAKAIGVGKLAQIQQIAREVLRSPDEAQQALCKGLASCILQYFYQKKISHNILDEIAQRLGPIDYTDSHAITRLRKDCLIDHLKLDLHDHNHLSFWADRTASGVLNLGGQPVLLARKTYRVPHRVRSMMQATASHHGSYLDLVDTLDDLRVQPLGVGQWFKAKYRHEHTKQFYESPDIREIHFEAQSLESPFEAGLDSETDGLLSPKSP